MRFIMNEYKFAGQVKNGGDLGDNIWHTLSIMAKYYIQIEKLQDKEIRSELCGIVEDRMPTIPYEIYSKQVSRIMRNVKKHNCRLYEIDKIEITKAEMERIGEIHSEKFKDIRIRRLAFTLLCFAKWDRAKNHEGYWVNFPLKEVFRCANITGMTKEKQNKCIHELYKMGMIGFNSKVDSLSVKVLFADDNEESEIEVTVSDINEAGNIYSEYCGKQFVRCKRCGKMLPRTNNRLKYCGSCAQEINREKTRKRMRELRKND